MATVFKYVYDELRSSIKRSHNEHLKISHSSMEFDVKIWFNWPYFVGWMYIDDNRYACLAIRIEYFFHE